MRRPEKHMISLLCMAFFSVIGCRYIPAGDLVDTEQGDMMLPVPDRTMLSDDPGFSLHEDTVFLNGVRYGGRVLHRHTNGDTAALTGYLDGIQEGLSMKWYPNGMPAETRTYHRGQKVGLHKGWWENGEPRFEYQFSHGEHDGPMKEWYDNGKPYKYFNYRNGHEDGSQRMWWENGSLRANYVVRNGRRYGLTGLKLCSNPDEKIRK